MSFSSSSQQEINSRVCQARKSGERVHHELTMLTAMGRWSGCKRRSNAPTDPAHLLCCAGQYNSQRPGGSTSPCIAYVPSSQPQSPRGRLMLRVVPLPSPLKTRPQPREREREHYSTAVHGERSHEFTQQAPAAYAYGQGGCSRLSQTKKTKIYVKQKRAGWRASLNMSKATWVRLTCHCCCLPLLFGGNICSGMWVVSGCPGWIVLVFVERAFIVRE